MYVFSVASSLVSRYQEILQWSCLLSFSIQKLSQFEKQGYYKEQNTILGTKVVLTKKVF